MLEFLTDPNVWASLLTLTALEIVLGIDNVIFIALVSGRLPLQQQPRARRLGLALALVGRLVLLASIAWLAGLTEPVLELLGFGLSWRDIVLIAGGLFLLAKGTSETHHMLEGEHEGSGVGSVTFASAIVQILLLDIVFSLDSVITAVGMVVGAPAPGETQGALQLAQLAIMVAAVVMAMAVMLFASGPVSRFVNQHPTVKMLALSFLLLVGVSLVADGLHFHIPRGYLYFAIAFSVLVEALNLWAASSRKKRMAEAKGPGSGPAI